MVDPNMPSDARIEAALRAAVRTAHNEGNLEELTIKTVRTSTEISLALGEGFLKSDEAWRDRSKEVITQEVDAVNEDTRPGSSPASSPPPKPKPKPDSPVRKKRKTGRQSEPEVTSDDDSDKGHDAKDSDSDMSVLIEEPTKATKKIRRDEPSKPSAKSQASTTNGTSSKKDSKSTTQDLTPDESDIKRLQSELLKCGVRKFWSKELAPFETSKAKIAHLKSMLRDVGMTGRFSADKAKAIKERRELEADVDALTRNQKSSDEAGERSDNDDGESSPPMAEKRRKVASRLVDFGDSESDE